MQITIKKEVARRIGFDYFTPYGVSRQSWESYREEHMVDLSRLSRAQVDGLGELLERYKGVRGSGPPLADLRAWQQALDEGSAQMKARTVRQFETLLKQFLLKVRGHRIYKRHEEGAILCYYVNKVEYHPPSKSRDYSNPAYVEMQLLFESLGGQTSQSVHFHDNDCRNTPVVTALANMGYVIENPVLREGYLNDMAIYGPMANVIGKQYWGRGLAYSHNEGGWWGRGGNVQLDRYDEPSRVVIDVFSEGADKARSSDRAYVNYQFWRDVARGSSYVPDNDEEDGDYSFEDDDADDEDLNERQDIEVPVHPWVIIFHLTKHLRLRCHVRQLEEYVYDKGIADKLVLPRDQKQLVQLLIETRGGMFQDIVRSKGSGAVVLLSGPPGTGKTLTAEVYAESEERALYSVQCSQLGTDATKLEAALMTVFERAKRWNAVMLLDEADVYVHERGSSMAQNAIVGVFLRVLEYQGSTMFLTTNRPDDVDDAIASRCIARLSYQAPDPIDQRRIWRVLADNSGIKLDDDVIDVVVERNPGITGRDIKNILKLGALMVPPEDGLTVEEIEYVQQFKPTGAVKVRGKE